MLVARQEIIMWNKMRYVSLQSSNPQERSSGPVSPPAAAARLLFV